MNDMITGLIADTNFWVLLSTVLCIGFIAFKAAKPVVAALDDRANTISARLAEAEALRNEAAAILAEYQVKANQAMKEADEIVANAQRRAEQMRVDMEEELKQAIARQELNAKNRMARLEEEAMTTIKAAIISEAMTKVKAHVANDTPPGQLDGDVMNDLKQVLQK